MKKEAFGCWVKSSLFIVSSVLIINWEKGFNEFCRCHKVNCSIHFLIRLIIFELSVFTLFASEAASLLLGHLFLHTGEELHGSERSACAVLQAWFFLRAEVTASEVGDAVSEARFHGVVHHSETDLNWHLVHLASGHIHFAKVFLSLN